MRPVSAADHSPPSSAEVMEEYSYTSTHPLGHTGPVTGSLSLYLYTYCDSTERFDGWSCGILILMSEKARFKVALKDTTI